MPPTPLSELKHIFQITFANIYDVFAISDILSLKSEKPDIQMSFSIENQLRETVFFAAFITLSSMAMRSWGS